MPQLYIGNKNYSSWSMRPWVLLKQAGIDFEEVMVRFDSFDSSSKFKATLGPLTPTGKVPLLVDGDLAVWDTLAIAEYVAEQFSGTPLWPHDKAARARARSVCAEMHAGFTALRGNCPMNIEADLTATGALIWRDKPAVRADVARLVAMWEGLLDQYGGPLLLGQFSVADADAFVGMAQAGDYRLRYAADATVLAVGDVLTIRGQQYHVAEDPARMLDGLEYSVRLREGA